MPIDPGAPPLLGGTPAQDQAYKDQAVEVIRRSSLLDAASDETIDISPASVGGNTLGTNDGTGHPVNPATGQPYAPDLVKVGDYSRALTEYWADGPKSETPPGHWNVIANEVGDALGPDNLKIGGQGTAVDRLQWDVKAYLALNGAVHDAAIAAWGLKGHYDSVRPISMIRYLAGLGQSSDPVAAVVRPGGHPARARPRRADHARDDGRRASATRRSPGTRARSRSAPGPATPRIRRPRRAASTGFSPSTWVPYQLPTFVTPAFQGYTSGHSTFSRAAAEVLTAFTGSEYFPGGLGVVDEAQG